MLLVDVGFRSMIVALLHVSWEIAAVHHPSGFERAEAH